MTRSASVLRRHLALIVAGIVAVLLALGGNASGVEEKLRLMRDRLHDRPASGQIVIVEIDAQSLARFGDWPWPRGRHGDIVDRLHAGGAAGIAFDIDFSSVSRPEEDARFAAALARAGGGTILPTFRQPASNGSSAFVENLPIASLRDQAMLASVNVRPEADGQLTRYSLGVVTGGVPRPSFAALIAGASGDMGREFRIDAAINPATIPRISAAELLGGRVDRARIAGKFALIGATAIEMGDRFATPTHGVIPGVVIQALAAETLLRGTDAPPIRPFAPLGVVLVAIAAIARLRGGWASAMRIVLFAGVAALPFIVETRSNLSIMVVPALVAIAIEGALALLRSGLVRLRRALTVDEASGLPNARAFVRQRLTASATTVVAVRLRWLEEADAVHDGARVELIARTVERLGLGLPGSRFHAVGPGLLAWAEPSAGAGELAERIESTAALFRAPLRIGDRRVPVTPCFGIAADTASRLDQLLTMASVAARQAEAANLPWSVHDSRAADASERALLLIADLDAALDSGDLYPAYQPKWDIAGGRVSGAEALVRWRHPVLGPISPDAFIPVLEASGNMARLTKVVVETCLTDLASWHEGGAPLSVAVNLSAALLEDAAFVRALTAQLVGVGPLVHFVTLEVTESAAVDPTGAAVAALTGLRALGARVSIDDYGTGRATLSYLRHFPADEIKIDKSFVTDLLDSRSDHIVVRSTIDLARELGLSVVAEGVESDACLAALAEFGCDTAQGWAIGKPVPADVFNATWVAPRLAKAA